MSFENVGPYDHCDAFWFPLMIIPTFSDIVSSFDIVHILHVVHNIMLHGEFCEKGQPYKLSYLSFNKYSALGFKRDY